MARGLLHRVHMRWLAIVVLVLLVGVSHAERKRVAVLTFEGPSAVKARAELVKLVQKSHTVISLDQWNRTARALSATKTTPANVKKIARKLRVDAVIEATVTERSRGLRVRVRLRDGMTGVPVESLDVNMMGSRFDKGSVRDIKDELIGTISSLDENDADPPKRRR